MCNVMLIVNNYVFAVVVFGRFYGTIYFLVSGEVDFCCTEKIYTSNGKTHIDIDADTGTSSVSHSHILFWKPMLYCRWIFIASICIIFKLSKVNVDNVL